MYPVLAETAVSYREIVEDRFLFMTMPDATCTRPAFQFSTKPTYGLYTLTLRPSIIKDDGRLVWFDVERTVIAVNLFAKCSMLPLPISLILCTAYSRVFET